MPRPETITAVVLGVILLGLLCWPTTPPRSNNAQCPTAAQLPQRQSAGFQKPPVFNNIPLAAPRVVPVDPPAAPVDPPAAPVVVADPETAKPETATPETAAPAVKRPAQPPAGARMTDMPPIPPAGISSLELNFELPPLPTALQQLPNKLQEPSKWAGANWGPVKLPVDWSTAEAPLWRRELEVLRDQGKFPKHPTASMTNGDVNYAKNLQIFRAAPKESFTVLEVGLHPAEQKRAPLYSFFKDFLTNSKYMLFANSEPSGDLAQYFQEKPDTFIKGVTSEASAQEEVQKKLQTVDIIVGRAADGISGQLEAFRYFFVNLLRPGGVYFIEDVDMNFISNADTEECVKTRTLMMDYLRDMVSAQINHDWYMGTAGEYRADPFVNNWVQDVSCSRGSCVVTKKLRLFNRYANLVHSVPAADYDATIKTSRPPALSTLVNRDPHPNTDGSAFGPMSRPVRLGQDLPLWANDANIFKVNSDSAGSDKCAAIINGHQYHAMYSKVFAPWRAAAMKKKNAGLTVAKDWKMLEVGIGCDTQGDPAGGYRLYSQYIPNVEYNAFEFQWQMCMTKFNQRAHIRDNQYYLKDHVHQGDQSNYGNLKDCIRHFGTFDLIVDDGSHVSSHQISTFREIFIAALKPGGIFVLEDLQTSFMGGAVYGQAPENQRARLTAIDVMRDLLVGLTYPSWVSGYEHKDALYRADEPVLNWLEDIMCSREACVMQKRLTPLSSE